MTIADAQQQVDEWIKTIGIKYFSELTNMVILTEETGELARHIARMYGEQSYKKGQEPTGDQKRLVLADEMADVLWVLICLANQTGIDLTAALERNFEKKTIRDAGRHAGNEKLK
ncbi:nucleotide pyrophosphohydrolase [Niabella aquatica]